MPQRNRRRSCRTQVVLAEFSCHLLSVLFIAYEQHFFCVFGESVAMVGPFADQLDDVFAAANLGRTFVPEVGQTTRSEVRGLPSRC